MDLELLNNNTLETLGIVDVFKSLIWTRKYFESGSFELYAPATVSNLALIKKHNLIISDNLTEVGYIDTIKIEDTEEERTMITASGSFLEGILGNRVILQSNATLADLITNNCISTDTARIIPNLVLGNVENITFDNTCKYENLGEFTSALAYYNLFSYRVVPDRANKKLKYETYRGVDRSIEQTTNPQVTFSQEYDNLLTSTYNNSDVGAVDTVYTNVTGMDGVNIPSGKTLPVYMIEGESDFKRQEVMVDVPAVTYQVTYGSGEDSYTVTYIDVDKTLANMKADAADAVEPITENFEGDVSFSSEYKKDYDLGDIVTVLNDEWGMNISKRIYEIVEVYDNETNSITPTFGSPLKTIMDILKN